MVNLKAAPFHLRRAERQWVASTIAAMSAEEKVGQLFFALTPSTEEDGLKNLVEKYHVGGCRYNPAPGLAVRRQAEVLQQHSKLPLFIAANTEEGGDACGDGTFIGSGIKIGATGKAEYAYQLGKLSNQEAAAVGCNMAFAPVCDIAYNWQNTEILSRAFGRDSVQVAKMSVEYLRGAHTIPGFVCAAKHFPGNGRDFRDAHLANHVNDLSVRDWNDTYGKVYKALIKEGLDAVMVGHIMLPAYAKSLNPRLTDEESRMPATLCPELINGLLRGKLDFNGLVITDATHMVGMTSQMKRAEMLPRAINAGCDMLLFFNGPDEDFNTVLNAYRKGIISEDRMNDALTRILGMKAHMGLPKKDALVPEEETTRAVLGDGSRREVQRKISEDAITLVKYRDQEVLPLTPKRYPRVMMVHVKGAEDGMGALKAALGVGGKGPVDALGERLTQQGFETFIYESPMEKVKKQMASGKMPDLNAILNGKTAISAFTAPMDLVLVVCDVPSGRPSLSLMSMFNGEVPWYVFEVPVVVVSCGSPVMLADIPQARTYINCYDGKDTTLDALVEKLMAGPSAFRGIDPIDSFCGLPDARD